MLRLPTNQGSTRDSSPEGSSNRTFGLVFAGFFLLLGNLPRLRGGPPRLWALAAAIAFGLLALIWPRALTWPNRVWTKFGLWWHKVTSPVALAAIYVVGVLPVGIVMRLVGQDPLRLKRLPEAETYWIKRTPPGRPDSRMKNQF